MASLLRSSAATASRCGHSISTGATARNNGPGKSPLAPIDACAMASSATRSASRSASVVEQNGSTGTKSTVPAMVVRSASVGNRLMRWMPDSPAVSLRQLSAMPVPSEVTTPMPVTATGALIGPLGEDAISFSLRALLVARPYLSVLRPSAHGFHERHAFAAPVANGRDHDLLDRACQLALDARRVAGREQFLVSQRQCCKRYVHRKLWLKGVAHIGAGRAHRHVRYSREEGAFPRCGGLGARCTRDHGGVAGRQLRRERGPHARERGLDGIALAVA